MAELHSVRLGMVDGKKFCIGLSAPVPADQIMVSVRDGLMPQIEHNTDGTQTVLFDTWNFGWNRNNRWEDFETFVTDLVPRLGEFMIEEIKVDLDGRSLSLFAKE